MSFDTELGKANGTTAADIVRRWNGSRNLQSRTDWFLLLTILIDKVRLICGSPRTNKKKCEYRLTYFFFSTSHISLSHSFPPPSLKGLDPCIEYVERVDFSCLDIICIRHCVRCITKKNERKLPNPTVTIWVRLRERHNHCQVLTQHLVWMTYWSEVRSLSAVKPVISTQGMPLVRSK